MVLQCVWTITRDPEHRGGRGDRRSPDRKGRKALDEVYNQCLSMEMERKLSFEQKESRKEEPFDPDKPPPEPPDTRRFREPALYQQTDPMEPGSF
jgi:hypothetical protein